jgi:hypothetical protein
MKFLIYCLLAVFILSCTSDKDKVPDNGEIDVGIYSNEFFDFSLTIPEKWVIQNFEQYNRLEEEGKAALKKSDSTIGNNVNSTNSNIINLLTLFEFHPGSVETFNASFILMAERLPENLSKMDEKAYLLLTQKQLEKTGLYKPIGTKGAKVKFGNAEFYALKVLSSQEGGEMYQEFYTNIQKGYALVIIISYSNESQRSQLQTILSSINA